MKRNVLLLALGTVILAGFVSPASAQYRRLFPKREAIDVSSYPADIRHGYDVFSDRCSECHKLSLTLNQSRSDAGWALEVRRMQDMASSHISSHDADEITKFLTYHEAHRKVVVGVSPEGAGKELFEKNGCSSCHSIAGYGNANFPLDGIGSRRNAKELRRILVAPPEGSPMPPTTSETDVNVLVVYLRMLKNHGWGW